MLFTWRAARGATGRVRYEGDVEIARVSARRSEGRGRRDPRATISIYSINDARNDCMQASPAAVAHGEI